METQKVNEVPPSKRGLTQKHEETMQKLEDMKTGEILKIKDNRPPEKTKQTILKLTKRLGKHKYKTELREDAVYVTRKQITEEKEETKEEDWNDENLKDELEPTEAEAGLKNPAT